MVVQKSKVGSDITPYTLSDLELIAIGRIIRSCAEIEDIINLHLCRLIGISEAHSLMILGKSSISARLELAKKFSKTRGGRYVAIISECFGDPAFKDLIRCRNMLAHGVLLGRTQEDEIAFQIQEPIGINEVELTVRVQSVSSSDLIALASMAERAIPKLEDRLKLTERREAKRRQPLDAID